MLYDRLNTTSEWQIIARGNHENEWTKNSTSLSTKTFDWKCYFKSRTMMKKSNKSILMSSILFLGKI